MRCQRKIACGQCPFRKTSVAGWLGPWTAEEITQHVHGEAGFACHMSAENIILKNPMLTDQQLYNRVHVCVGSIKSANISHKLYRSGPLRTMQEKIGTDTMTGEIMDKWEFMKHHAGTPNPRKAKRHA